MANDDNQSISTTFDGQPQVEVEEREDIAFAGHTFPHDPSSVGTGSETRHIKQNGFRKGDEIENVAKAYLKWLYQPVNRRSAADVDWTTSGVARVGCMVMVMRFR